MRLHAKSFARCKYFARFPAFKRRLLCGMDNRFIHLTKKQKLIGFVLTRIYRFELKSTWDWREIVRFSFFHRGIDFIE